MNSLVTPWNVGIWAGLWLGLFCVLEGLAASKGFTRAHLGFEVPWDTFSRFIWDLQVRWEIVTVPVVAILAILASHLVRVKGIREGDKQ